MRCSSWATRCCAPRPFPSLPHLSLEPAHRRGWGSLYAALARGRDRRRAAARPAGGCLPAADPPVFAVDVTTWPRCDAECSPERGYYYHPSRHSAGQPIVAGWAYQWLAQLSFARDSWTAPVDARRLHPLDDTDQIAAAQIRALLARLPAGGPVPLFVFDAGYDSVQLALDLADDARPRCWCGCAADRCFYADPPPAARSPKGGRPRRHGAKFACADPTTWPAPTAEHWPVRTTSTAPCACGPGPGCIPSSSATPAAAPVRPRPIVRGTLVLVEVERLPRPTRPPKELWLWWAGPGELDLDLVWRAYVRRFDLEHTFRFAKQTLGWTTPRPRHPEQADRWTWLVLAAYTQLRLARARSPATSGCPGNGPDRSRGCHRYGCGAGFRGCCAHWARRRVRRNPAGAPQAGPGAAARGLPCAHPAIKKPAKKTQEQAAQDHKGRLTGPAHPPRPPTSVDGQPSMPAGLNHKLSHDVAAAVLALSELGQGAQSILVRPEADVYGDQGLLAEIDLWAIIDGQVVIGEAKTVDRLDRTRAGERRIAARMAGVAQAITADQVVLATTAPAWNDQSVAVMQEALERSGIPLRQLVDLGADSAEQSRDAAVADEAAASAPREISYCYALRVVTQRGA